MNILIINHKIENCGVYQYGKRFAEIAQKSRNYRFFYFELDNLSDFSLVCDVVQPNVIIYNYLPITMPWITPKIVDFYRKQGVKNYLIVHNANYETFFDVYLHQNPYYDRIDNKNFALCRPLFAFESKKIKKTEDILQIGSFGFGFKVKYFDQICKIINDQLSHRKVQINLHLTFSHFCPNSYDIHNIAQDCAKSITNDNIKINFTTNFISDEELLEFLYKNDLNIFLYQNYSSYNGISSTIDYALSVKKPLAICKSNMFSHIWDVQPSICIEDNSLENILKNGITPLENKYELWTHDNFVKCLEDSIFL